MADLYLIPIPITDGGNATIPAATVSKIHALDIFFVERARTARRFLVSIKHPVAIDDMHIYELDKNNPESEIANFAKQLVAGKNIGFMSESGVPCVADPGNLYVSKAHELSAKVIPLVGPSSILLALMASGLNGQNFHFHGYLPVKDDGLRNKLHSIASELNKGDKTHIFIETPYRNQRLFDKLVNYFPGHIRLSVAIDINSENERIFTKEIRQWKSNKLELKKENTVFLIGH